MVKTEKNSVFNAARFKKFYFHQIREQNLRHFLKPGIPGFIGQKQFLLTFLPDLKSFIFTKSENKICLNFLNLAFLAQLLICNLRSVQQFFFYNRYQQYINGSNIPEKNSGICYRKFFCSNIIYRIKI